MIEFIPNVYAPEVAILNPDESLAELTIAIGEAAIESIGVNSIPTNPAEIPLEFYEGEAFVDYWEAWQPTLNAALGLHNNKISHATAVDSFIELQMLLGDTGNQTNVGIFHIDMVNAAFLKDSADMTKVRDTHQITESIFTLDPSERSAGFYVFAHERPNTDINRSLYVLADNNPPEIIDLGNPSKVTGYKLQPGNIHDGEYLFESDVDNIEEAGISDWSNWAQGIPWTFQDITDKFHRAPRDTSEREILLRIAVYSAPARVPSKPISIRVPAIKYYFAKDSSQQN